MFRCSEKEDGKVVWYDPPSPVCRFRAFHTLTEGAIDYLTLLRKNFHAAWPAVEAGDPHTFVRALKAAKYFTDDVEHYEAVVTSIFHQFEGGLQFDVSPDDEPLDDATKQRVCGLIAASLKQLSTDIGGRDTLPAPDDRKTDPEV